MEIENIEDAVYDTKSLKFDTEDEVKTEFQPDHPLKEAFNERTHEFLWLGDYPAVYDKAGMVTRDYLEYARGMGYNIVEVRGPDTSGRGEGVLIVYEED